MAGYRYTRKAKLGVVGVDSGQLVVIDPCCIEDICRDGVQAFYKAACGVRANVYQGGQVNYAHGDAGLAVAFASGFGDGTYEVFAHYIDAGDSWGERIGRIEIVLEDGGWS